MSNQRTGKYCLFIVAGLFVGLLYLICVYGRHLFSSQRLADFFLKTQDNKHLWATWALAATQFCHSGVKAAVDNIRQTGMALFS